MSKQVKGKTCVSCYNTM